MSVCACEQLDDAKSQSFSAVTGSMRVSLYVCMKNESEIRSIHTALFAIKYLMLLIQR